MTSAVVCLGDSSSHGGTIVSGSPQFTVKGRSVARMGDLHQCPMKGHGMTPIVSGSDRLLDQGRPVARAGDVTGCGAVLVANNPLLL